MGFCCYYRRSKQTTISQCFLISLLMVLFNIGFWIDEWSTNGNVVNEVSQICFYQHEEYYCQTFEDLKQQTPDWVVIQRRSMLAAYIGVMTTFILTVVAFFYKWHGILLIILTLAACVSAGSTLASIGLFTENFSDIPGFEKQRLGALVWLFLVCVFLQVIIPVMVFIEWTRTLPDQLADITSSLQRQVQPRLRHFADADILPKCVVCLDEPRNVVIMPCGHLVLCEECYDRQQRNNESCPICRGPMHQRIRCYI